jgi:putative ABC transport system ATP-binding protein
VFCSHNEGIDVIQMHSVSKVFRTDVVETHALKELSLNIEAHAFVAITGPSGSGKTTFLNVAGLLEEFTSGQYLLDGKDVSRLTDDERSRIRNEKIGFIFQSFNLIPDLNIYDNVEVPLHYRGFPAAERRKRVTAALERVGLAQRMKHIPSQLSGGQQQRVAIARALAGEPRVILADEPTGNLDTTMSGQIMDLLEEINASGTTILMVTHNPELAMRAHRHIEIVDGTLAASRTGNRAAPVRGMAATGVDSAGTAPGLSGAAAAAIASVPPAQGVKTAGPRP